MKERARDLGVIMRGVLGSVGPGACGVGVYAPLPTRTVIRITAATDDAFAAIAADYEFEVLITEARGRLWWRQASSREGELSVVVVGPYHHPGPLSRRAGKP